MIYDEIELLNRDMNQNKLVKFLILRSKRV